jgi:hypothetical protein
LKINRSLKTQIAIEAAYHLHHQAPECSVSWVPAVNSTTFEDSYRVIGRKLGITAIDDPDLGVKSVIQSWKEII